MSILKLPRDYISAFMPHLDSNVTEGTEQLDMVQMEIDSKEESVMHENLPVGHYLMVCDPVAVEGYDFVKPMLRFHKTCGILEHPESHCMPTRMRDLIRLPL